MCQNKLCFLTPLVFSEPAGRWSVLFSVPTLCQRAFKRWMSPFPPLLCFQQSLSFLFPDTATWNLQCCGVRWKVAVKAPFAAVLPLRVLVEIPWISAEVSPSPSFLASEELGSFSSNTTKRLELVAAQARVISSHIVLGIICHLWLITLYSFEETFLHLFWPYKQPIFFLFRQNGNDLINMLDVNWRQWQIVLKISYVMWKVCK